MEGYTALKPINLGGRRYCIGETVPLEAVADIQAVRLERTGYLVRSDKGNDQAGETSEITVREFCIPIVMQDGGRQSLPVTEGELQAVFEILQTAGKEAVEVITGISSESVLRAIHVCDSRKAVKEAACKRAEQLFEPALGGADGMGDQ